MRRKRIFWAPCIDSKHYDSDAESGLENMDVEGCCSDRKLSTEILREGLKLVVCKKI